MIDVLVRSTQIRISGLEPGVLARAGTRYSADTNSRTDPEPPIASEPLDGNSELTCARPSRRPRTRRYLQIAFALEAPPIRMGMNSLLTGRDSVILLAEPASR